MPRSDAIKRTRSKSPSKKSLKKKARSKSPGKKKRSKSKSLSKKKRSKSPSKRKRSKSPNKKRSKSLSKSKKKRSKSPKKRSKSKKKVKSKKKRSKSPSKKTSAKKKKSALEKKKSARSSLSLDEDDDDDPYTDDASMDDVQSEEEEEEDLAIEDVDDGGAEGGEDEDEDEDVEEEVDDEEAMSDEDLEIDDDAEDSEGEYADDEESDDGYETETDAQADALLAARDGRQSIGVVIRDDAGRAYKVRVPGGTVPGTSYVVRVGTGYVRLIATATGWVYASTAPQLPDVEGETAPPLESTTPEPGEGDAEESDDPLLDAAAFKGPFGLSQTQTIMLAGCICVAVILSILTVLRASGKSSETPDMDGGDFARGGRSGSGGLGFDDADGYGGDDLGPQGMGGRNFGRR